MFEEYLQDAQLFLEIAQEANRENDDRSARRYYRASVFYTAGAIEAFLNYIADSFAKASTLTPHEIAYINDKNLYFAPEKLKMMERTEFHRLEDKLKFLIKRFSPDFNFSKNLDWIRLMEFKDFRDGLVHPRQEEDQTSMEDYQKRVSLGLSGVIGVMNSISEEVFGKPLRRNLRDLVSD